MSYSVLILVSTVCAATYGLLAGNWPLFALTVLLSFLKYKEEASK